MRSTLSAVVVLLALGTLSLPASPARAQDGPAIDITDPRARTYKIAVQQLHAGSGVAPLDEQIDAAIRGGLAFSDLFTVVDERAFLEDRTSPPIASANAPSCENWAPIGADALVQGQVEKTGAGLRVEFRLWDVTACKPMIRNKRFTGSPDHSERIGKVIADEIVAAFTGQPGVADTEIAFISARGGAPEVYVMDANGDNQRAGTRNRTLSSFPSWAPTGDRLVYTTYRYRNRPWLFLVSRGAKSPGRILRDLPDSYRLYRGVFAPTGRELALVMSTKGQAEIFRVNTDGSGMQQLTRDRGIDVSPSWSPDGRRIAFVSDRTGAPQVYVMNSDGTGQRRLTYQGNYNTAPDWSPDGRWIAYETRNGGGFDIWLTDPEGRQTVPVVEHRGSDEHPSWSPDGRKLAFQSTRAGGPHIYTVDLDGSHLRRLTTQGENKNPAWGPYRR
jgi:TolB protein